MSNIFWICLLSSFGISFYLVLINKKGNGNRYWLPSIWTTIGILGTFWSLLENINGITDETFLKPKMMVEFIKDFATAFSTSLVGITGSLVIKGVIKTMERIEIEKEDPILKPEQYFLDKIEQRLNELILLQPSKESLINWQSAVVKSIYDQKNGIESKLGELDSKQSTSISILKSIDTNTQEVQKTFQQTAEELVTKLHESLSPILEGIGKSAFDKIESILESMDKQLSQKMGEILGNLDSNLSASIEELVKTLEEQTKDTNDKILKGIESLVGILKTQTEETNKNLLGKISTLITSLESYLEEVKVQNETSLKGVNNLLEYLKTKTEEQESQLDGIDKKQQENYSKMLGFYDEWQNNIQATNNQIANNFTEYLGNIGDQWGAKVTDLQNKYVDTFQNIAKDMGEKFLNIKEILEVLTQSQKEYKTFAEETSNSFNNSVTKFGGYMREMENQAEKVKEFTEKINDLTIDVDKVIREYADLANFQKEHRDHTISISKLLNEMTNLNELIDHLNKYK